MKNSRNTIAKQKILELIQESTIALSHSDIQTEVGDLCNRVTIYRVLDRLVSEGDIHKIVNIDGVIKYAACTECAHTHHHHNHIHFSCTVCHEVTCLENLEPSFKMPKNYQVEEVQFTLSGICPQCLNK